MIGQIKVHEVRHTGAALQACRPFTLEEFIKLVELASAAAPNEVKSVCF